MGKELEGCERGLNKVLSWNFIEGLRQRLRNFNHDNQFLVRGSKRTPPEYKSCVFPQTNLFFRTVLTLHWYEVLSRIVVVWDFALYSLLLINKSSGENSRVEAADSS
jgi:hypothetical protein